VSAPQPYQPYQRPEPYQRPVVIPPGVGLPRPVAVQAVPGAPFGVAIVGVAPTTSGPAVASLVTGVGSILVSFVVSCFGAVGANGGWGPVVSGAFAALAALVGVAAIVLGAIGRRQMRRSVDWGATRGGGMAVAGMICGAVGLLLAVFGVVLAIGLAASATTP
jgi:hypothetical protein